ncbi:MAG: outer membrane beta-barrel protein [Spirochaetota bacterium]
MNHSDFLNKSKLFIKYSIAAFSLITALLYTPSNSCALESETDTPKVRIGAGGLFGYYDVNAVGEEHMNWGHGFGYGGGLVYERMFTGTFGLHSGIWFSHFNLEAKFSEEKTDSPTDHKIKSNIFTVPFYLITSFGSGAVILNLLTGINLSYIAESYMKETNNQSSENIQKHLGYCQVGAGGGIEILFRITKFTRFFISCVGEYHFTNLISDSEEDAQYHLYNATARAGFMLCTF